MILPDEVYKKLQTFFDNPNTEIDTEQNVIAIELPRQDTIEVQVFDDWTKEEVDKGESDEDHDPSTIYVFQLIQINRHIAS